MRAIPILIVLACCRENGIKQAGNPPSNVGLMLETAKSLGCDNFNGTIQWYEGAIPGFPNATGLERADECGFTIDVQSFRDYYANPDVIQTALAYELGHYCEGTPDKSDAAWQYANQLNLDVALKRIGETMTITIPMERGSQRYGLLIIQTEIGIPGFVRVTCGSMVLYVKAKELVALGKALEPYH